MSQGKGDGHPGRGKRLLVPHKSATGPISNVNKRTVVSGRGEGVALTRAISVGIKGGTLIRWSALAPASLM